MIKIYPSRLEGEPLEVHDVDNPVLLTTWLASEAKGFSMEGPQPICIDVDGKPLPLESWTSFTVHPDTDLRIYPEARASAAVIAAWAAVALAAVSIVMILTMPKAAKAKSNAQGDELDSATATANQAKLNSPIREVLGRAKVFPDYLTQPISRFVNKRQMHTTLCLCVGVGRLSMAPSLMKIGETPFAAFGSDLNYTIYGPGETLPADARSENWFRVNEVGGTGAGTAGLDLASTAPSDSAVVADSMFISGGALSLIGNSPAFPDQWGLGTSITLSAPDTYTITNAGNYSRIAGQIADLAPFVGMKVTLRYDDDLSLTVASFSPYVPPVPGIGGTASSVTASAAPTTLNFSTTSVAWSVVFQGATRTISLNANYASMAALVSTVTAQLSGIGLVAQDSAGKLKILEPSSPYKGGAISLTSAPVSVFGSTPVYVTGAASTGGNAERSAFITLNYDSGTPFAGLPEGQQRLALGYRGLRYTIQSVSGLTATIRRLTDTGAVDASWVGFTDRTLLDFSLAGSGGSANWIGSFMGCPENELATAAEYDIFFSQGLCYYDKKARLKTTTQSVQIRWRDAALAGAWNTITHTYTDGTPDQIGFTESVTFPYPLRPEFQMRRVTPVEGGQVRDAIQWYGLRTKLPAKSSYPGVTAMTMEFRGGDRLSAQSERQINCVPVRIYDTGTTRSIKDAALYVCDSLGIDSSLIDIDSIQNAENTYWQPRGELYDMSHEKQASARDVLAGIFTAGMSHLTISDGLLGVRREGIQSSRGAITPHEMTSELSSAFVAPSPDDFDGVDVEYVDQYTNKKEVRQCRLDGSLGLKVDKIQLNGVTDNTRAWRIGMRQLRKYQLARWSYSVDTELDALVFEDLDHVTLADDIPGTTKSALITDFYADGDSYVLTLTEEMDWSVSNPRALIRRHDGTVTRLFAPEQITWFEVRVPSWAIDFDLITDLSIEPARFLFGPSEQVGYPAMITEITPNQDGTCAVSATEYSEELYADDDNFPPT
ncbi:host specificity factor TipJ family phage tail protein [Pseudomonas sp. PS01303]|uniref:host specificity factor TipJ family phage tail protein n=1 Tax=Pseudomonas sp. PS01303 TaxID=2991439 RepID=UPI00249BA5B8|nr:host specificity factor TipJ family phage tail protein [Pseudomonas sp. PS01303]